MTGCRLLDSESKTLATLTSTIKLSALKESIMYIKQFLEDEVSLLMMFPEGKSAIDYLEVKRRKPQNKKGQSATRKRVNESGSEDEEEEEDRAFIDDDDNSAYETDENGVQRKLQKSTHGRHKKKPSHKKRKKLHGTSSKSAPEKEPLVIKSSEFVSPSDDESDEERDKKIYEREALQIQRNAEMFKFPTQRNDDSTIDNRKQTNLSIFEMDENIDDDNNVSENSDSSKNENDDNNSSSDESDDHQNSDSEDDNRDRKKKRYEKSYQLGKKSSRRPMWQYDEYDEYDNIYDDDPTIAAELEMERILGIDDDYSDYVDY